MEVQIQVEDYLRQDKKMLQQIWEKRNNIVFFLYSDKRLNQKNFLWDVPSCEKVNVSLQVNEKCSLKTFSKKYLMYLSFPFIV